jgi:serine phosphatase RsbU (regulator of sigma subunit)
MSVSSGYSSCVQAQANGVTPGDAAEILLVEDDAGDAVLVEELLAGRSAEFRIIWVRNLADALSAVGPSTDCVLFDLGLPDAQGLDGLQTLLERNHGAAVVVLTGIDDRLSGERALVLGAQDYLSKGSVTEESLSRALRYSIARRRGEEVTRRLRDAELLRAENSRLARGLLPRPLILNPALSWATRYEPGGRRALLGGDFFDAVELEDGTIRIVIGDVCGHGPDEAALGVALRVAWRAFVLAGQSVDATLGALERLLRAERTHDGLFTTVCDIEIDPGLRRAQVRLAGHPSPLLFDGTTVIEVPVILRSPPLGAIEGISEWVPSVIDLTEDWTILAFTDGIIEGRVGGGVERLATSGLVGLAWDAFEKAATLDAVVNVLLAGAEAANGAPLTDDVALLAVSASPRWRR